LAKNRLDARGRAKLAADLIEGRASLGKLTAKQTIQICRTNAPYVAAVRKSPAVAETLAERESLVDHIRRSSSDELAAAAKEAGIDLIWDSMVAPNVT
jgi:hypothetical protein